MRQQGEYTINNSVQVVWLALNDPATLQAAMPGCESLQQLDEETLKASVRAKVGPVNAVFQVNLSLSQVQAPHSYTLNGEIKGGAGVAKGTAHVQLEALSQDAARPSTRLVYEVQASVGGKLAQIGSRLIDSAAKKMADDFFAAFSEACMQADETPGGATQEVEAQQAAKPNPNQAQEQTQEQEPVLDDNTSSSLSNGQPKQRASDGIGFIWITAFVVLILAMVLAL